VGPFTMTVLIVLIVAIAKVLSARYKALGRQERAALPAAGERDELRALRERVAVLERVVTDTHQGSALDREIERLRDERTRP